MAPTVEKKIAELEMGLLHLQQNIDIPEITLPVNPIVAAVIKKCADENRKPKVTIHIPCILYLHVVLILNNVYQET